MIGRKIKYHRKKLGLTLEQLSLGICSLSYLSKIEKGVESNAEIIELICAKLGISNNTESLAEEEVLTYNLNLLYDFIKQKDYGKSQKYLDQLLEPSQQQGSIAVLAHYYLLKFRYELTFDLGKAKEQLKEIELLKDGLTPHMNFYYHKFLGLYYYLNNNNLDSLRIYKEAEEIANTILIDKSELADVYFQMSLIHIQLFQISLSIDYCLQALKIYEANYQLVESAECQSILGINYHKLLNFSKSELHFNYMFKIAKSINNGNLLCSYYHNLGFLYSTQGRSIEALLNYKLCLKHRSENQYFKKASCIFLISNELIKAAELKEAYEWIEKGLSIAIENSIREYEYHFRILYLKNNEQFDDLIKLLTYEAIPYFTKHESFMYVSEYSELLAKLYSKQFQYKEASKFYCLANESRKHKYLHQGANTNII